MSNIKELTSGTIIKLTSLDGSTGAISVVTGTEEPFEKRFLTGIDVSGSFKTPQEQTYAFHVEKDTTKNQLISNGVTQTLTWDVDVYNYNIPGTSTAVFQKSATADSNFYTARVTGLYQFSAHILIEDTGDYTNGDRMDLRFYYGTGNVASLSTFQPFLKILQHSDSATNEFRSLQGTTQIYLTSGQRVALKVFNGTGVNQNTYNGTGAWTRFEGRLVQQTG